MTAKRRQPEKALAEEMYARRREPANWEEVEVAPTSGRAVVTSFRLPEGEFATLHEAAEACGETLSEFIRKAVALRLHGKPLPMSMDVTSGATYLMIVQPVYSSGRTEIIPAGVKGGLPTQRHEFRVN